MLLSYSFKNFRSYYDKQVFSLKVSSNISNSIPINQTLVGKNLAAARSSIVLGYNGTGKSNFIHSLLYLIYLMKASFVNSSNKQPIFYSYEKFRLSKKAVAEPMEFNVEFIANDNNLYDYYLNVNGDKNGMIINQEKLTRRLYTKKERLSSPQLLFLREKEKILTADNKIILFFQTIGLNPSILVMSYFMGEMYINNEAYNILKPVKEWFNNIYIINADRDIQLPIDNLNDEYLNKITKIMKKYSMTIDKLAVERSKLDILPEELSTPQQALNTLRHKYPNSIIQGIISISPTGVYSQNLNTIYRLIDSDETISSSVFDNAKPLVSNGEKKLIFLLPYIFETLKKGSLLIIDEFDSSLNKIIAGYILDIFNDKDINKNFAQIILTTQNELFVDHEGIVKEQIFLTSKNNDGKSQIRNLSEISKDADKKAYRNGLKLSTYIANEVEESYPKLKYEDIKNILI